MLSDILISSHITLNKAAEDKVTCLHWHSSVDTVIAMVTAHLAASVRTAVISITATIIQICDNTSVNFTCFYTVPGGDQYCNKYYAILYQPCSPIITLSLKASLQST